MLDKATSHTKAMFKKTEQQKRDLEKVRVYLTFHFRVTQGWMLEPQFSTELEASPLVCVPNSFLYGNSRLLFVLTDIMACCTSDN